MRRLLVSIASFCLFVVAEILCFTPSSYATSTYDDYVVTTDQLEIWSDQSSYPCTTSGYQHGWSYDWEDLITDPQYWAFGNQLQYQDDFIEAFEDSLESGGWAVSNLYNDGSDKNDGVIIQIAYSPSGLKANWSSSGVNFTAQDSSNVYLIDFQVAQAFGCQPRAWQPARPGYTWFGNDNNTTRKIYFASGDVDMDYPSGYDGTFIPTAEPAAKYVAMGDSFSSGEGNAPFEFGTDTNSVNECHRSSLAYPRLLQQSLDLGATAFVACSGAKTSVVGNGGVGIGSWGEDPQVDVLSTNTDVVTITIGGNDIKFSDFANACTIGSCNSSSDEYQESWDIMTNITRSDNLNLALSNLLSMIEYRLYINPSVEVYVMGYPYLITYDSWNGRGIGICSDFDADEASAAEALVDKLNDTLETAVSTLGNTNFTFVDPTSVGSPFLGHEICGGDSYFNWYEYFFGDTEYMLHPNANGQQAYAELIVNAMS